jgi:menaquinone-dependent protoporphyrinogen oxidase
MKTLVAYDTKNGSTAEVAQAILLRLREHGLSADIQLSKKVRDLKEFDCLVVGAPIYSGRWLSGAHRILRKAGKLKPEQSPAIAIFALGPRRNEGPENWTVPQAQFDRAISKHPSVRPVSRALFGGADPPKKSPRRDIRDWEAIKSWADELAGIFLTEHTSTG